KAPDSCWAKRKPKSLRRTCAGPADCPCHATQIARNGFQGYRSTSATCSLLQKKSTRPRCKHGWSSLLGCGIRCSDSSLKPKWNLDHPLFLKPSKVQRVNAAGG